MAITLMLLLVPGALRNLPQPTLAAVVITASLSLADVGGTVRLRRQRPTEFAPSITAFAGVSLLGVLPGIAVAVALSIANVFRHAWWPCQTVLGRVAGLPGYHDVRSYPDAELLPGCVLFRFDGPLFFANTRTFREQLRRLARADPAPRWIVVAAEPITDVDTTAADMLEELDRALNAQGVSLVLAEMKDPVRRKLERYELTRTIKPRTSIPRSRRPSPRSRSSSEPTGPPPPTSTPDDSGGVAAATPHPFGRMSAGPGACDTHGRRRRSASSERAGSRPF